MSWLAGFILVCTLFRGAPARSLEACPPKLPTERQGELQAIFARGVYQANHFRYGSAVDTFEDLLRALRDWNPAAPGWELFVEAQIYLGVAWAHQQREEEAMAAFGQVLRIRPAWKLSLRDFSPKILALWERARQALEQGLRIPFDFGSATAKASVWLDGVAMGSAPLTLSLPPGRYHVLFRSVAGGEQCGWVDLAGNGERVTFGRTGPASPGPSPAPALPGQVTRTAAPWPRRIWPYAAVGTIFLGGAVASHLSAHRYSSRADGATTLREQEMAQRKADLWIGLAIGQYTALAATILTGLVLHEPAPLQLAPIVEPTVKGVEMIFSF